MFGNLSGYRKLKLGLKMLHDCVLGMSSDEAVDELAGLEDEEGGDAFDVEAGGGLLVFVHVELADHVFAFGLTGKLSEDGGAIMRQGGHHAAQKSTRTGRASEITDSKFESVTVMGWPSAAADAGSFWPHLPQTGWVDWARDSSTRFLEPQLGQVMIGIGLPLHPMICGVVKW